MTNKKLIIIWVVFNLLDWFISSWFIAGELNPILRPINTIGRFSLPFLAAKIILPIIVVYALRYFRKMNYLRSLNWGMGLVLIWNLANISPKGAA